MNPVNRFVRIFSAGALIGLLGLFAGCSTPLLYDQARDRQGQDAIAAAAAVDLAATVDAIDKKFKDQAALEAATLRSRNSISRGFVLRELVQEPSKSRPGVTVKERYVDVLLDKRIGELGGPLPNQTQVSELSLQAESKLRVLSQKAGTQFLTCASIEGKDKSELLRKLSPVEMFIATPVLNDALAHCQKLATASSQAPKSGLLFAIRSDIDKDQEALDKRRNSAKLLKISLEKAIADSTQGAMGETQSERIKSAAEKVQSAIKKMKELADATSSNALKEAEADLRLESLDTVLKALSSGASTLEDLTAKERRAVLVVRLIPSLVDEVGIWNFERERIRLAPLVLAKEHQRLALEGFHAETRVLERRLQIRGRILAATEAEFHSLRRARLAIEKDEQLLASPMTSLLDGNDTKKRFALYTSFTSFDVAEDRRLDANLEYLELASASADQALATSRSAAKQWQSLATNIAAVLGDYHAKGVKPADWIELLKAFGIIGIAAK